jgi:hypothetical protein
MNTIMTKDGSLPVVVDPAAAAVNGAENIMIRAPVEDGVASIVVAVVDAEDKKPAPPKKRFNLGGIQEWKDWCNTELMSVTEQVKGRSEATIDQNEVSVVLAKLAVLKDSTEVMMASYSELFRWVWQVVLSNDGGICVGNVQQS